MDKIWIGQILTVRPKNSSVHTTIGSYRKMPDRKIWWIFRYDGSPAGHQTSAKDARSVIEMWANQHIQDEANGDA